MKPLLLSTPNWKCLLPCIALMLAYSANAIATPCIDDFSACKGVSNFTVYLNTTSILLETEAFPDPVPYYGVTVSPPPTRTPAVMPRTAFDESMQPPSTPMFNQIPSGYYAPPTPAPTMLSQTYTGWSSETLSVAPTVSQSLGMAWADTAIPQWDASSNLQGSTGEAVGISVSGGKDNTLMREQLMVRQLPRSSSFTSSGLFNGDLVVIQRYAVSSCVMHVTQCHAHMGISGVHIGRVTL